MRSSSLRKMLGTMLLLVACSAYAQDSPISQSKKWDFSIWVAGATGEENTNSFTESQIFSAGVAGGRMLTAEHLRSWRRGRLEYAFDFVPIFETYGNQRAHGVGFDPVILRWNSSLHTTRVAPYIDLGGGGLLTDKNLPPGNTSSFNFTPKGGGGIYVRTRQGQAFDIGLRWSHISNANLGVNNPEFNGIQLSLAYHWFK